MNKLSFKEFLDRYELKDKATSNVKLNKNILDIFMNEMNIHDPCGVYMRDAALATNSGIVKIHLTKGSHWVMFVDEFYFDSYGCPPSVKVMNHLNMSQVNRSIYSESLLQKNDSYCAAYCLYVFI